MLHLVILLLLSNFLTHTAAELHHSGTDPHHDTGSHYSLNGQPFNPQYYMLFCTPQICPISTGVWTYPDPLIPDSLINEEQCKTVYTIPLKNPDEAIAHALSLFLPNLLSMDQLHEDRLMAIDDLRYNYAYTVSHHILMCLHEAATTDHERRVKELQTQAIKKELDQITGNLINTCNREQALLLYEMARESLDRLKPATAELRIAQQSYMMALSNLLKLFGEHQQPMSCTLNYLREQVDHYFQSRIQGYDRGLAVEQ